MKFTEKVAYDEVQVVYRQVQVIIWVQVQKTQETTTTRTKHKPRRKKGEHTD